jgi:cysteine desulfurase
VKEIYLDWAATAVPDPEILEAQRRAAADAYANPSSLHFAGKAAKAMLEDARSAIARLLKTKSERVIFCSGGTEANQIALSSLFCRQGAASLQCARTEHPSVYECALGLEKRGLKLAYIKTDSSGRISPSAFERETLKDCDMVCLCAVNNEIGTIQDIAPLAEEIRKLSSGGRVHIHVDAVQAFGKIGFLPESLGIDSASFSAHKLGGPRGIGFLWTQKPLEAFLRGGGQEGGLRSGTENVSGAVASAMALEKATEGLAGKIHGARERMEFLIQGLLSLGAVLLPAGRADSPDLFSPWILQAALPPVPGEVLVRFLSDARCAISTGSACSSSRKGRRVLDALGIDPALSQCAFRVSQGPATSRGDIEAFLELMKLASSRLKVGSNG